MPKHKKVGNYELKETIGKGTFSKVKRAINTETGEIFAIKIININSLEKEGMEKQVKREILVLKNIKHRNVVQMVEVLKSTNHIYIVMELVTGGELFDKIVSQKRFDEDMGRHFFHQLIDGIQYCHDQDVAHRDLKPENLLLDGEILKISDFGLSGISRGNMMLNTICGTPHYVAPEVLSGKYDGKKADIWSCGIILFVMISGCHPFDGESVSELFKRIESLEFKYPSYFSKELRALLDKIIVVDPDMRATLEDIINDAWFKIGFKPSKPSITGTGAVTANVNNAYGKNVNNGNHDQDVESAVQEVTEYDEKKRKSSVVAKGNDVQIEDVDKMNAFELVSYLMKDKMSTLIKKEKVKPTSCFIAHGAVDDLYQNIVKELNATNPVLKQKDHCFVFRCKTKSAVYGDLEFNVKIIPVNCDLLLVESYRLKGNILKYHEAIRSLTTIFGCNKNTKIPPNATAYMHQKSRLAVTSSPTASLSSSPVTSILNDKPGQND